MKYLKTCLGFREYKAFPDRIAFKGKCVASNNCIRIPTGLRDFADFGYAFVQVNGKSEKFRIRTYNDRKMKVFICFLGRKLSGKIYDMHLKTNGKFSDIVKKALDSRSLGILGSDKDVRLHINKEGRLLLKFLVSGISKTKSHSIVHKLLKNKQKTIPLGSLKAVIKELGLKPEILASFVENYYVHRVKKGLKFPDEKMNCPKEIYRLIGLVNGDGHLSRFGVYFYGHNKNLHADFKRGIKAIEPNAKFKKALVNGSVLKTYTYSAQLARKIDNLGAISGNKLITNYFINIPNNFHAYAEYLSGFFDTEGSFIKDGHLAIASSVSIRNPTAKINLLSTEEHKTLLKIAKTKGKICELPSGYRHYRLGLNSLKGKEQVIKKISEIYPATLLAVKRFLGELGINSKLELKYISIYPKNGNVNIGWWNKITLIEDVIKFAAIVDLHDSKKKRKIHDFVLKYITTKDFLDLKAHLKVNGHKYR